jgi:hypothetical protein
MAEESGNIDVILSEFNAYAQQSKNKLEEMLEVINEGCVPSVTERKELDGIVGALQQKYESICYVAKNSLIDDEIPNDGSSVNEFYNAVKNNKAAKLRSQLAEIKAMLQKFVSVQSLVDKLTAELEPFQKDAELLIEEINDEKIGDITEISDAVSGPELFLQAVACEDLTTDEGNDLLDALENDYGYSNRVTRGLFSKKYFIPEGDPQKSEKVQVSETSRKSEKSQETKKVEEDKTEENTDFVKAFKKAKFALKESEFGILHHDISTNETKKISASIFENDIRKGNENITKLIVQYITGFPLISPELLELRSSVTVSKSEDSFDFLYKKGYLRKYEVIPGGVFYSSSPRLDKALTYKEASKFVGVHKIETSDLGKEMENKVSSAAARYALLYLCTKNIENNIKENKNECRTKGTVLTESFICSMDYIKESKVMGLFIGTFWTEYDECDKFMEQLKEVITQTKKIIRFVIAAETRACAEILAAEIKKCGYEQLEEVLWFIYSLKENEFYRVGQEQAVELGEIWSALAEKDVMTEETTAEELHENVIASDKEEDVADENIQDPKETEIEKTESETELEVGFEKSDDHVPVVAEISGEDSVEAVVHKLINAKKEYCATAYAKVMASKNSKYDELYDRLSYALNDPMNHCLYSADISFKLIPNNHVKFYDALVIAIGLRTFFSSQVKYDYNIKAFYDAIKEYEILNKYHALGSVMYKLADFKGKFNKGIDTYADYHAKSAEQLDDELKKIQREAKIYYDSTIAGKKHENTSMRRFLETKKALFNPNGDIGQYIKIIVNDEKDMQSLMVEFLQKNFIREGNSILEDSIDADMLWAYITKFWEKTGEKMMYKMHADLISRLRSNITNVTTKAVQLMIRWCNIVDRINARTEDEGSAEYKKIRKPLLDDLDEAVSEMEKAIKSNKAEDENAGLEIIRITLVEIKRCIEGGYEEYERRYFYVPFLMTDDVLLDETFYPNLDMHSSEIKEVQPEYRILQHAQKPLKKLDERLAEIFEDGEDDYGTAKMIIQYLTETGSSVDVRSYENNLASSEKYAKETADLRKERFVGELELAQSYGQIDNVSSNEDKKEKILHIVNEWYDSAVETGNYGFFKKIMDSYLDEIRRESKSREKDFVEQLNAFRNATIKGLSEDTKEKKIAKIQEALNQQNYTVAEDLLARINLADDEYDNIIDETFLKDFLDDYDDYYKPVAQSGSFAALVNSRTRNKEERGGKRLAENWLPGGSMLSKEHLTKLLAGFGFKVDDKSVVKSGDIGRFENFIVKTVAAENGRNENYTHPIAAFGSGASQEGFRVVCLNGKYEAKGLIDVMKQIGNTKHTMILLDCALSKPERRSLARKTKSELGDKLFVVIDRVVMMYMVKNYDENKANRMLMSLITPFGYYQPYVWESSNVMPPEIFMGRKHELERIESATGVNIVYGGRQLGKSALLKKAKADIDRNENGDRAVLVDIKGLDYREAAKKIGHTLYDEGVLSEDITASDWDELSRVIRKRLQSERDRIPYLLLLMDEADAFIESCEEINYRPFDSLKEIQSLGAGRFKFVIAGLRNIVRFKREAALGNNSVLTHLEAMTVKPFKSTEARELMEIPLHYLGFEFPKEKESLITLILASTNYFPGLIQMYCAKLLSAMRNKDYAGYDEATTPIYEISEEHIKKVLADPEFMEQIREKYIITLKLDEDNYYYLIALIMAYLYHKDGYNEGYSAKDVLTAGKLLNITKIAKLSDDKMYAFMEELKELNVLRSTDETHYLFTRFTFFQMMGTISEVEDKLLEYMED